MFVVTNTFTLAQYLHARSSTAQGSKHQARVKVSENDQQFSLPQNVLITYKRFYCSGLRVTFGHNYYYDFNYWQQRLLEPKKFLIMKIINSKQKIFLNGQRR